MRKLSWVLIAALCCTASTGLAGPNAGGMLMAHQPNLLTSATDGTLPICDQAGDPSDCLGISDRIDGAVSLETARIWIVYAVFPTGSSPRVKGVAWALNYNGAHVYMDGAWNCGDWELSDTGWPGSGFGSEVTWTTVQTSLVTPVYAFSSYTDGTPTTIAIAPNPHQGGRFGDDTIPAILDPIADYGVMGFDTSGHLWCLPAPCCHDDGTCTFVIPDNCLAPSIWRGDLTTCSPNGCPQLGACCNANTGNCTISLAAACAAPGIWHGEWTLCAPNPCPTVAACCNPTTQLCSVTIEANCTSPSVFHPEWTSCTPDRCPASGVPAPASEAADGLMNVVPNPFGASTALWFRLSGSRHVRLDVFDPAGQRLWSLDGGTMEPGVHSLEWNGRTAEGALTSPGVYFARLTAGQHSWTRTLIRIQ